LAEKAFDQILLESVDDALASLGDSAKQAIYFHLQNRFKVEKKDIPKNLRSFETGLERIFGAGAKFIEIIIMKKLHEKVGQPLKWDESKELVFTEYVTAAKQAFIRKESN
jgi:hypothetical protein